MEHRIPLLALLFSLFFAINAYSQPCIDVTNPASPPAVFTGNQVGNSFVATNLCYGVLSEIEVKIDQPGGNFLATLIIYEGLIDGSEVEIYSQGITLTPGNNMIQIEPQPGDPLPCLTEAVIYTFVLESPMVFSLQGYDTDPYIPGQAVEDGVYDPNGDVFFSITGTPAPEIEVSGLGFPIPFDDMSPSLQDGTDFGMPFLGSSVTNTFVILNEGPLPMNLTGNPFIQLSGDPEFTLGPQPLNGVLGTGNFVTFTITYTPTQDMVQNFATVIIPNDDCNESPFTFLITGKGIFCDPPDIPTLEASANNVCPGSIVTLSILTGALNDAEEWVWYDDACGSNQIGTGTSIVVTPTATTTYYVRGEGGCPAPGSCAEITVIAEDNEDPVITCPDPFTLEVDALCEALIPDLTLLQGSVLTNSKDDFSNTQGVENWYYGFYEPFSPQGFTELDPANFSNNTWFGVQTSGSPFLDSEGGHPGVDDGVWAVRRWVSNYTGPVTISGEYWDRDLNCGDGANVRIFHNGAQVFQALSIPGTANSYSVDVFVLEGDQIDLAIDPILDTGCDDTELTAQVSVNSGLVVTDNCGLSMVTISQDPLAGTVVGPGVSAVELTATDGMGNTASCTVEITYVDNILPDALCQDVTVELNAQGTVSITAADINNGSFDNCGIESLTLDLTSFNCDHVGANTVTLTVVDVNQNESTCSATVTVEDNIAPTALCQDFTLYLNALGEWAALPEDIDNGSFDNCGIASLELDISNFTCEDVGENAVVLTVTDDSGNMSTCSATITVADVVVPEANCMDITVTLDATGNAIITPADIDDNSNDACGVASLDLDITAFDCTMVGMVEVTLTVTDENNNFQTCTAIVTVEETENPVAICQDITVELDETGQASIEPEDINNGSSDVCGLASLEASQTEFDCSHVGPNTVTLTVTDNNGNISTCDAIVTIVDVTAPEALCQDFTVALDAMGSATIAPAQVDNGSSDACGIESLALDINDFFCDNVGPNVVTLTVTDVNNNSSTCTATITVIDDIFPTALCQDITVELNAMGEVELTPDQIDNGSSDNCGQPDLSLNLTLLTCDHVGPNIITLTVEDASGNQSSCSATVTVEDNLPPTAVCQDVSVQLDADGFAQIQGSMLDGGSSDNCGIDEFKPLQSEFNCDDLGPNPVLVTVVDNNGNESTCIATVTVFDLLDPVAVCQNAIVQLNPDGTLTLSPSAVDGGTTDNCSFTLELDVTEFTCDEVGVHTLTLTATDPSGNSASCTATVTVQASAGCPVPDIKNFGGPNVEDPCTCRTNGEFAEEIVIGPTLPGMGWVLTFNQGYLDPMTLQPYAISTPFIEIAINMGESIYVLPGVHMDGVGYAIEAESPFFPGVALAIANVCYYPEPQIVGLGSQYCLNSTPVVLEGNAGGVFLESESFMINGIPAMVFDPMALGAGIHEVKYTVDAGTATPNDPNDPGCMAMVVQEVEVTSESPGVMVCNDLIFVSVNENCEALITGDMVLEGDYYCYDDFEVQIFYNLNQIPNPVTSQYIGLTLDYTVVNLNNWNECSGQLILADLLEPVVLCSAQPFVIGCDEDLSLVPPPLVDDNCTVASLDLISQTYLDTEICDDGIVQVEQVWIAADIYGNISEPCTRLIEIHRTANSLIDFPNDITWECTQYQQYPNITQAQPLHPTVLLAQQGINPINATVFNLAGFLANTGSGVPGGTQGTFCGYSYIFSDQVLPTCGNSFQIIRTWTVLDECTGELITGNDFGEDNIQIITVADVTPPVVTVPGFTLSANIPGTAPGTCLSQGLLPPPVVTDNCNSWTVRIFTPIGEAIYLPNGWGAVPAPGLPLGSHLITYQVMDICGNTTTVQVEVEVIDDIAPTVVCDEITDVALSSDGLAVVNAFVFDDGSTDNCCISEYLVRRQDGDCEGNYDDFGPTVTFCCTDVENSPITVIMRVVDCFGNSNDCVVIVNVNDNNDPILLSCPENAAISCDEYNDSYMMPLSLGDNSVLDDFGTPLFLDNCLSTLNVDYSVSVQIDNCGQGVITRSWTASDDQGNGPVYCLQSIQVYHVSDWVVEFPAHVTAECTDGALPDTGEPEIFFDECELIATSFFDQVFTVVPDACYKIERTWTVINWCIYNQYGSDVYSEAGKSESNLNIDWDGDGDKDVRTFRDGWNNTGSPGSADGYITYKQIIKVIDEEAPQFVIPAIDGCILEADCKADIVLPYPDILDDCSLTFDVEITGEFGTYQNVTGPVTVTDVIAGTYDVVYSVRDNCGNTSYQTVTIEVEDCLKPKVICEDLVVDLMQTGMVSIDASEFDEGSSDNCGSVGFSYTQNVNDLTMTFTCDDLGPNLVQIWVTDETGNQDFCEVTLFVQDNIGVCNQATYPTIAGLITNEDDEVVEGAMVEVNSGSWSQQTSANGLYNFNLPAGGDYSIAPVLDEDAANGVTTYDMVLIQRHILGVNQLGSPYKIIAADANKTGSVTTLDLVAIRKVILQMTDYFPNNTSWRFVEAAHSFANPQNPWQAVFPEVINYNDLSADDLNADFIAIKVGDVNGSATANAQQNAEERTVAGTLSFHLSDRVLEAGETCEVPFYGDGQEVFGYQYTLELGSSLELIDLREGVAREENFGFAKLDQGALTTSWNEAMPRKLGKEEVMFTLLVRAETRSRLSEILAVSSRFTAAEAYNPDFELLDVKLVFHTLAQEDVFELYQNEPNPFSEMTTIRFNLPQASEATLTVMDASGRVLANRNGQYDRGAHEIRLSELGDVTGVLYYRLETAEYSATKKMIKVK